MLKKRSYSACFAIGSTQALDSRLRGNDLFFYAVSESVIPAKAGALPLSSSLLFGLAEQLQKKQLSKLGGKTELLFSMFGLDVHSGKLACFMTSLRPKVIRCGGGETMWLKVLFQDVKRSHGVILLLVVLVTLVGCGAKHPPPRPAIPGSVAESIVQTALSKTGRPYSRGGTSPNVGFDCSGLVVWVYGKHGVELPRMARDQSRVGSAVPYNQLQGGDLVFFRISSRGAYHVGIATGRGTFIHSPKPGQRVREVSLFDRYWQQRFVGVRRVL